MSGRRILWKTLAALGAAALVSGAAQAATLQVVGGQLVGALGVDVDGTLYDVSFLEGTCITLFSGCDNAGADFDFYFTSSIAAGQALLDQVFIDGPQGNFDSDPTATFGCSHATECKAMIPYGFASGGSLITFRGAFNRNVETSDGLTNNQLSISWDSADYNNIVYADFSPSVVPEPATGTLVALGLAGLAVSARRHKD